MYKETSLMYPYFHSFFQENNCLQDFTGFQQSNAKVIGETSSTVEEYDLGGIGDLFNAPESIIEESELELDPMTIAISSMISGVEDAISSQAIDISTTATNQADPLSSEIFYECKKDLLENSLIDPFLEELDVKIPSVEMDELSLKEKEMPVSQSLIQRSVSSGCLSSTIWVGNLKPNFLDFQGSNLGNTFPMRRSSSESNIQTINHDKYGSIKHPFLNSFSSEDRKQKLSRYRKKRAKRNFGRKIKYACRKALADSQPRIHGRFAKTEDLEVSKPPK